MTNVFVTNTNSLWAWTSTGWEDTGLELIRGDEFQYKLSGVLKTLNVLSQDSIGELNDFQMSFDNSLLNLQINIPYVAEGKYFHNWLGQLPNNVENFERGTTTNGRYMKLWVGTKEEYLSEFVAPPDGSVVTMINNDTTSFEGTLVDEAQLETRLNTYTGALMAGTQINKRYVIKPKTGGIGQAPNLQGWGIEEWVPERFVQVIVDPLLNGGITNIIGAGDDETGILRYNAQDFALLPPGISDNIDPVLGINYKGIQETVENNLVDVVLGRTGLRAGSYITIPDLQNNFGVITNNKPLLRYLIDTSYQVVNYPNWVEGTPGALSSTGYIQNSISKLWSSLLTIDIKNGEQQIQLNAHNEKLNKYPNPTINVSNSGNYVFTIANSGSPTNMSMTKLSDIIGTNPLSELVNINQWTHGTGNNVIAAQPMTGTNFSSMFAEASKTKYTVGGGSTINNLLFWVGTKAQYAAIGSKSANNLYFCTDGGLYFGNQLIAERTITTSTVVSEMTAPQVQTLLNKLGQV